MYFHDKNDRIHDILTEKAMVVFVEISSGIYLVDKDRKDDYPEFTSSNEVIKALNYESKVVVKNINGDYFSNFDVYDVIKS
jgi:hypothetical protein